MLNHYRSIPDHSTCLRIVKENPVAFMVHMQETGGFVIKSFNYRIPDQEILRQPLALDPEISAMELRGITFVTDPATGETRMFLMLPKFYNIEEAEETSWKTVKGKQIDNVTVKRDGSLIRFILLPDGKVIAKTQKMIGNEQAFCAERILSENEGLRKFVEWSLRERIALLFELTAPDNLVVLPYFETRLTLVKAREEDTGRFVSLSELEPLTTKFGIDVVEEIQFTNLSNLINLAKEKEMFEGWVVQFSDGQLMKLKTTWYAGIHNLCTSDIRENEIIKLSIEDSLDDILSALRMLGRQDVIEQILPIHGAISGYVSSELARITEILSGFDGDKKVFSEKNRNDPAFGIIMSACTRPENLERLIKDKILKATKTQVQAVKWLKEKQKEEVLL